jgi:hypothetical protein
LGLELADTFLSKGAHEEDGEHDDALDEHGC